MSCYFVWSCLECVRSCLSLVLIKACTDVEWNLLLSLLWQNSHYTDFGKKDQKQFGKCILSILRDGLRLLGWQGSLCLELVSPYKPQPLLLTEALGLKETKVFIQANSGQSADWGAWLLLISCWRLVNSGEGTRTDFANLKDAVQRSCARLFQQGSELPDSVRHTVLVWNRILSSLLYMR